MMSHVLAKILRLTTKHPFFNTCGEKESEPPPVRASPGGVPGALDLVSTAGFWATFRILEEDPQKAGGNINRKMAKQKPRIEIPEASWSCQLRQRCAVPRLHALGWVFDGVWDRNFAWAGKEDRFMTNYKPMNPQPIEPANPGARSQPLGTLVHQEEKAREFDIGEAFVHQ